VAAVLVVAAAGLFGWWASQPSGVPYPRGTVGLATGTANGVYDQYGRMLKPWVQRSLPGVGVRLDPSAGGLENLRRVAGGQDDFAIATVDAVARFQTSEPGPAGRLRGIARLYDDYVQLVVPAESPVRSVADLRGRRVGVGQAGSGVALISERVLRESGLAPGRDLTTLPVGIHDAPAALAGGRLDAFFWSGGLPTGAVTALAQRTDVRLVPLGGLVAGLNRLAGAGSPYRASTIPAGVYPGTAGAQPVATAAVANVLVTRADVAAGLVERFTGVVLASRDAIGKRVHPAQLVDSRTAIYTDPLPLADGARRYYVSTKP
jgi:hypothetical protein